METALQIVNLLNAATPGIANLIILIRRKDGTVTVAAMLDEAESSFNENIRKAKEWLEAHPKP